MGRELKFMITVSAVLLVTALWFQLLLVPGPFENKKQQSAADTGPDPDIPEGRRLSEMHCSSCHKYPSPGLLPWQTWRFETLGAMAPFLGIDDPSTSSSSRDQQKNPYIPDSVYPAEPRISEEEWKKIRAFYLSAAPPKLARNEAKPRITVDSLYFRSRTPRIMPPDFPAVTAVAFDPGNRVLFIGEANESRLLIFNQELEEVERYDTDSPVSHIKILGDTMKPGPRKILITLIGNLYPGDAPYGSVLHARYDAEDQVMQVDSVLWDRIARPVESQLADLDGDGSDDLLVNEFGHRAGNLFWMENIGNKVQHEKKILIDRPGCIQSHVMDYTRNGHRDILALCTQTDQAIYLFENRGAGEFHRQTLLRFEVTAGSSSFEVHDFNQDGNPDILYTSGDNADFSQTLKPYHGVYIYLNDGRDEFTEAWFYPVNGAYNAKARDFNGNGRLDIAVISYFADYANSPEEGFIYFENQGDLSFIPYHHPAAGAGRWLTMDVADWTGNGRPDIVLGSFPEGPFANTSRNSEQWRGGPCFLVLENQSHGAE
ncbi:FG-GAP repeat domain-containing protein [Halalkalibaculum sp. DA384]|uniref:FG-GAP repeat domain-containing protein n=1 Tax=Halalkalibaculum sp. DA384 TaxID=3373606 RepID=UPI00375496F5